MCQRYVLSDQLAAEREFMPVTAWWRFDARFNVAAEQSVPAVRVHDNETEAVMLRWGLIPSWLEGKIEGPARISVGAGRLDGSKTFRPSWVAGRRCILPMAGFYLWHLAPEGYHQPYFLRLRDRAVFGVAGIWDRWQSEEDDVIESCALVTVPANELVSEIGGPVPGMPAILRRKDYGAWLHGNSAAARATLQPYKAEWMHAHPVSPRVNSVAVDDANLILAA